jgi:hypothetical protein
VAGWFGGSCKRDKISPESTELRPGGFDTAKVTSDEARFVLESEERLLEQATAA